VGDIISTRNYEEGTLYTGYSSGINKRTRESGLYPSYKVRETWRIVDFPIFNEF
jgi:glycoprotein 6-alpha-L-fucosyltransferase